MTSSRSRHLSTAALAAFIATSGLNAALAQGTLMGPAGQITQAQANVPVDYAKPGVPGLAPEPLDMPSQVTAQGTARIATAVASKPLGLEQKAWLDPNKHKSPRQTRPGFVKISWRPDDVMEVNAREGLLSVIKFPRQEEVVQVMSSDPGSFETSTAPNKRSVAIRAIYPGVDGNLIVYGSSGNVYNFYLRSLPFNADRLPDTTVEVVVGGMEAGTGETLASTAPVSMPYTNYKDLYEPAVNKATAYFDAGGREYARGAPVNPGDMRNNISIEARSQDDAVIAPIRAWHDGRFTYLDFGPNASSMTEWPVAALVIQGVESPVGTRVAGKDRSMMVIEAIGNITLRNGGRLVCLRLARPLDDNRYAKDAPIVDPRRTVVVKKPVFVEREVPVEVQKTIVIEKPVPAPAVRPVPPAPQPPLVRKGAIEPVEKKIVASAAPLVAPMAIPGPAVAPAPAAAPTPAAAVIPAAPPPAPVSSALILGPYTKAEGEQVWNLYRADNRLQAGKAKLSWQSQAGGSLKAAPASGRAMIKISGVDPSAATSICDVRRRHGDTCLVAE
ncbi:TrbG/VirB9 family P-type conjugative transfer protein [Microvirga yunnanensis]|uniref:TrbG/VirB9 family P-type conjugative transfer protein n=1 Tax=Microvirga yunnanensis TaxID=2953740 RepID=UPI0021C9E935|nr:TrbG/VirB9 family P-type conjugative transfer protein [Microvirga sp. HBU65207]